MRGLTALLFSALALAPVVLAEDPCAQASPEDMARDVGIELPSRPWHLANIWWKLEQPVQQFDSLEMDITIDRDVPESYNLYISPCGSSVINGLQFYGGIQTNINGWENKESRERVHRGRGGIFSRWSADQKQPIGLDHVRVAGADCLVESAGYEGEFASVRRPYSWKSGTYTWSITKGKTIEHQGEPATWFTCRIQDSAGGPAVDVGSLLFEGEEFTYGPRHSAFVEVYATSKIPRSAIPKVNVTFGWPRINGKKAAVAEASAYYPNRGVAASPDCANVRAEDDHCIVEVGEIFLRDEAQRSHKLDIR